MRESKDTASLISLCVQWFEEAEDLSEILRTQDRERPVADEQVCAHGCNTVDVTGHRIDGYPVVECDPCGDQGIFETGFDDEQHVREAGDNPVPGRQHAVVIDSSKTLCVHSESG